MSNEAERARVAIAGASGFVGRALVEELASEYDVIALARHADGRTDSHPGVEWRSSDLFDLRDAERGLCSADIAVYLVHSMMPSARLTQGRFDDLDLICADNFARAASVAGVKHIVYLGGLMPKHHDKLSRHLASRLEVERALGSHGVPVTTLRAGLVIGAGGSSFDMMAKLAARLPIMLGPRWTRSLSQPIALADAVSLLAFAIRRPDLAGRAYDIAGPDVLSYADMLRAAGEAQGKPVRVITLPIQTMKLSLLWVSAITGASQALVRPLVESLRHDMVASDGLVFQKKASLEPVSLRTALEVALREEAATEEAARNAVTSTPATPKVPRAADRRACSVQRLAVPSGHTAAEVAAAYAHWLPRFLRPLLRVEVDATQSCRIYLWPFKAPLLELTNTPERSAHDRQLFFVTGGLLASHDAGARARLEFRSVLGGQYVLAAVFDFLPRLPWFVYKYTQARVHLLIMRAFARYLVRVVDRNNGRFRRAAAS